MRRSIAFALIVAATGCSSGHTTASQRSSTTTAAVHQGDVLAMHAMAYLAPDRATALFQLFAYGPRYGYQPDSLTVGRETTITVGFFPLAYPVWIGAMPRRMNDGGVVARMDGCPTASTAPCARTTLYAPTADPIAPMPTPGVKSQLGFALQFNTVHVEPRRYDFEFPIIDPSDQLKPTVLDTHDVVHVRLDIASQSPDRRACTSSDLQRAAPKIPSPHVLSDTYVFGHAAVRLDPPPSGARPKIPATDAVSSLAKTQIDHGGGTATVVLALLSQTEPRRPRNGSPSVPEIERQLAYVLYRHRDAGPPPHGPPTLNTRTTVREPPCIFYDGLDAIDANTGVSLGGPGYAPGEADPVNF